MLGFNREDPIRFKEQYPDTVIFIADESKNPQSFMGSWSNIKTQTLNELQGLLDRGESKDKVASNWGILNGAGNIIGLDFEWPWVYRVWVDSLRERGETYTVKTANGLCLLSLRIVFHYPPRIFCLSTHILPIRLLGTFKIVV